MAYEKNIWATGDVVTAEKLNHMEEGIEAGGSGGGVFVVTFTAPTSGTNIDSVDKTFDEVLSALKSGANVIARLTSTSGPDVYMYCCRYSETSITFSAGNVSSGVLRLTSIDYTKYGGATYGYGYVSTSS